MTQEHVSESEIYLNINSPVTTYVALGKPFTSLNLSQWEKKKKKKIPALSFQGYCEVR